MDDRMDDRPNDDQARGRWAVIQAVRIAGVVMTVVGLFIVNGNIPAPEIAGYVLLAAGLVDVLLVPTLLARKWRTPPR